MGFEDAARASVAYNYAAGFREEHPERIEEDIEWRLAQPFNAQAYRAQMFAAALHNCYGRLDRIQVPTLVVHGTDDRVIPVENAHLMAERLPDCRLTVLEATGHLYVTELPEIDERSAASSRTATPRGDDDSRPTSPTPRSPARRLSRPSEATVASLLGRGPHRTRWVQNAASSFGATCFLRLITPGRSISPLRTSHSNARSNGEGLPLTRSFVPLVRMSVTMST